MEELKKEITTQKPVEKQKEDSNKKVETPAKKQEKQMLVKKKKSYPVLAIVAALDLVLAGMTFLVLSTLSGKAIELKKIKNEVLDAKASSKVETSDLELNTNVEKIDRLKVLFPNETGLVGFIKEIEKLKEAGIVKNLGFVSQEAVRDKAQFLGIPFAIEMEGTWEEVDANLQTIQKLPYLIRTITIETKIDEANVVKFKYGGFIYVDESLAKNR